MKNTTIAILAGIAAVTAIYLINKTVQGGATVLRSIGDQVDPTNPDNYIAAGINKVGGVLVDDPSGPGKNADGSWTFGGWIYDVTHTDPLAPTPPAGGGRTTQITPIVADPYGDPMGYYYP